MNPQKHFVNSSNISDLISFSNNQSINQFHNYQTPQESQINITKSQAFLNKDNQINNKININSINSSINISKKVQNSINEQKYNQNKKEQSNYLYSQEECDEEEDDPILKEYTSINNQRSQIIDELKNINEKIKNNNSKIEEYKTILNSLKADKKQKQADIVNLLSNKESIEEIYKNKVYILVNNFNIKNSNEKIMCSNNIINISMRNENSNNNTITIDNNEIINNDEDNFKIYLNDIKESDQNKFIEQVTSMADDIFQKG